jgi:hypothetical protein
MRIRSELTLMASCAVCSALLTAMDATADEKSECAEAHASGQRLQREGHFREARKRYEFCARDRCPAVITKDCDEFLRKLEDDSPTLVIAAHDRSGKDTLDVRVVVDGEPYADRLTGLALPMDPGRHVLQFSDAQGSLIEQTIVAHVGEKNRPILVDFSSRPPPPPPLPLTHSFPPPALAEPVPAPASKPVPISVVVLGSAGILTLASFAAFGITALVEAHDLQTTCAPNCGARTGEIQSMRVEGVVSDISLGSSIVLLGTATALYFAHKAPRTSATGYLMPIPRGAAGVVSVAF